MAQAAVTDYFNVKKRNTRSSTKHGKRALAEDSEVQVPEVVEVEKPKAKSTTRSRAKNTKATTSQKTVKISFKPIAEVKNAISEPIEAEKVAEKAKEDAKTEETTESKKTEKQAKPDLLKLDAAAVRDKLAKCGKLEDLKQRLAEFSLAKNKLKEDKAQKQKNEVSEPVKTEPEDTKSVPVVPAYQRYSYLAVPAAPSLTLPFKYRLLIETFTSVEAVVSMLHKRSEICTFSKLKAAVQHMTKKAFETKHIGQIQTVYPTAYTLRQEKGLPNFATKAITTYQLTVDADLKNDLTEHVTGEAQQDRLDDNGRPAFTATKLLHRKTVFQRNLVNIVMKYHEAFLSKLQRPLNIPVSKITRWHPKFVVDEVPDIELAALPEPPDYKKFTTAKEVLEEARDKPMNPRVKQALETVAANNEANIKKTELSNSPTIEKPNTSKPNTVKGVSQSLLERIRAKEANKLATIITRTPEEDRKRQMLGRLPDLARIVRSYYVTQKKPVVLLEDAVQKLVDSYRSSLQPTEADKHLQLMIELLPDWISVVKVKKGTYLKLDKNKDLTVINERLQKALKDLK